MHPVDINAALMKLGHSHQSIAAHLNVSQPMVSQVVWRRTKSRRVAKHIAKLLGQPVDLVFDPIDVPATRHRRLVAAA